MKMQNVFRNDRAYVSRCSRLINEHSTVKQKYFDKFDEGEMRSLDEILANERLTVGRNSS